MQQTRKLPSSGGGHHEEESRCSIWSLLKLGLLLLLTGVVVFRHSYSFTLRCQPNSDFGATYHSTHWYPNARQQYMPSAGSAAAGNASGPLLLNGFSEIITNVFPQIEHCGLGPGSPRDWLVEYAILHAETVGAATPVMASAGSDTNTSNSTYHGTRGIMQFQPVQQQQHSNLGQQQQQRYLVSVPHLSGTADHIIGMVTQFYLALLGQRAFTEYSPSDRPPGLAAACDFPFFNWTHPAQLPQALLTPLPKLATSRTDMDPNSAATYPPPFEQYALHNMVNPLDRDLELLGTANLTDFPAGKSGIPYIISTTNRGASYSLLRNPYHKDQFWRRYGLRPETAFMCGFWSLCSPNTAVQSQYAERFWKPLTRPDVLKIGIQVRFGDQLAFLHKADMSPASLVTMAAPYFECAAALEQAFAAEGQSTVWYVISDSSVFRSAVKELYGEKVLTDDELQLMHVACHLNEDPSVCKDSKLQSAVQHALGEMLSFSLTDYQIITQSSGFGRVGAWLSGRWGNIYELAPGAWDAARVCPRRPTSPKKSANHWSRI